MGPPPEGRETPQKTGTSNGQNQGWFVHTRNSALSGLRHLWARQMCVTISRSNPYQGPRWPRLGRSLRVRLLISNSRSPPNGASSRAAVPSPVSSGQQLLLPKAGETAKGWPICLVRRLPLRCPGGVPVPLDDHMRQLRAGLGPRLGAYLRGVGHAPVLSQIEPSPDGIGQRIRSARREIQRVLPGDFTEDWDVARDDRETGLRRLDDW